MATPGRANRLAQETSPYLLQHRFNPVDWYPWGEEAFARAREEDKPVLLSVGYSACHWCHVMERECFENEAIAGIMNRYFINVKVDREERPDIDAIYMQAVQLMTGQGGWPMTVFLTPDGRPFYAGTYFPPEDRYGRPGFPRVLEAVAEAWRERRAEVVQQGEEVLRHLKESTDLAAHQIETTLTEQVLERAFETLARQFDPRHGGFGYAPKFPQPANLDFLLRFHARSRRQEPLAMVEKTLQRMALGGIYDQLGGGFHRYSTDAEWLVPHFEKMLYDNAQLAQVYARCYQATGKSFYRGVAEEILDYVLREMTGPQGEFYSAQDADSEGEEGRFFVWTPDEVRQVLGERDGTVFCAYYDITPHGNWEGRNVLRVVMDVPETARLFGLSEEETVRILDEGRARLFQHREQRVRPGVDDKVLTAWNGLMLAAFAECGAIFQENSLLQAAERNARFVRSTLVVPGDPLRLLRTCRHGQAKLNAYLEDYAFYADGLLHLYAATGKVQWFTFAQDLIRSMLALFRDPQGDGFFATSSDHEALIHRLKDWDDNATPSGNSVAVEALLRISALTGDDSYRQHVAKVLRRMGGLMERHPYSFARMLGALDFYLSTPEEIVIVGEPTDPRTQALLQVVYREYRPNRIVAMAAEPVPDDYPVPLLRHRVLRDGQPAAYVCERFVCKEPVTTPEDLQRLLKG